MVRALVIPSRYCSTLPEDTMDTWDDEKLQTVVLSKYGNPRTTTDVRTCIRGGTARTNSRSVDRVQILHPSHRDREVSWQALSRLRRRADFSWRFGWFWECPNGDNCQYRHALPPGFMLKSQRKALEEAEKAKKKAKAKQDDADE